MDREQIFGLRGQPLVDTSGDKIGTIEEIYLDDQTQQPEWLAVGQGFLGTKRTLVPLQGAQMQGDAVTVPYSKDQVKQTPDIDAEHIDQSTEERLYAHYGLDYSEAHSDTGLPTGTPSRETQQEGSITRSEEQLNVGKQQVEAGQVRLRKWVETEPVNADVELRQETARVEREPINQPVSGAEIGEAEVEVDLHAERPVVEKQTVAKERVSLEKDVEMDTAQISDEVRKERVEVDGDGVSTR